MAYLTFNNLTNQSFIKAEAFNMSLSSRTYVEKMSFYPIAGKIGYGLEVSLDF